MCVLKEKKGFLSLFYVSYIHFDKSFEENSFIYLQQAKSEIKALNIFAQMREEICYLNIYCTTPHLYIFMRLNKKEKMDLKKHKWPKARFYSK